MRKLYVTKNLGDRGYQIESEDGRFVNRISHEDLIQLTKRVIIVNAMEDEEIELLKVAVEDYDTEFDVVVTKFIIEEDSNDIHTIILDDYSKTYKKENTAIKYANKVRKELEYLMEA